MDFAPEQTTQTAVRSELGEVGRDVTGALPARCTPPCPRGHEVDTGDLATARVPATVVAPSTPDDAGSRVARADLRNAADRQPLDLVGSKADVHAAGEDSDGGRLAPASRTRRQVEGDRRAVSAGSPWAISDDSSAATGAERISASSISCDREQGRPGESPADATPRGVHRPSRPCIAPTIPRSTALSCASCGTPICPDCMVRRRSGSSGNCPAPLGPRHAATGPASRQCWRRPAAARGQCRAYASYLGYGFFSLIVALWSAYWWAGDPAGERLLPGRDDRLDHRCRRRLGVRHGRQ
jgi:hypothetical protein